MLIVRQSVELPEKLLRTIEEARCLHERRFKGCTTVARMDCVPTIDLDVVPDTRGYGMDERDGSETNEERIGVRNKALGAQGEKAAARYLTLKGFEIVEMNWTCPAGEADIIAWGDECLVFCEVKTRTNIDKGFPSEAVTKKKRQKYEKIAAWYLQDHDWLDVRIRFDVIDILVVAHDRALIKHIVDAFGIA